MSAPENQAIDLFTPVQLGPYTLPNRMVMAPMTRNRAADGNLPNDLMATYYRQRTNSALAAGDAVRVAFGVPYIANPDLVQRFAMDAELNEPDMETFYGGGAKGYTDYEFLTED